MSNGVKQGSAISPLLFSIYIDELFSKLEYLGFTKYGSMLSLTVHYIIEIFFFLFRAFYIYILFSVVHMSLVMQCIFLCTLRSICYVQIKIIIINKIYFF